MIVKNLTKRGVVMKTFFSQLFTILIIFLFISCNSATVKKSTGIYVKVKYKHQFDEPSLAKYDIFFEKSNTISEELKSIEENLNNLPNIVTELISSVLEVKVLTEQIIKLTTEGDKILTKEATSIAGQMDAVANQLKQLTDPSRIFSI